MQSVVRAASLGQLARVSASAVPNTAGAVAEPALLPAAPTLVQSPGRQGSGGVL